MHAAAAAPNCPSRRLLRIGNIIAAIVACAGRAAAVTVDAGVEARSDYRFRGVSLSDRSPVVSGSVTATAGPWFAGVEAIAPARGRDPIRPTRRTGEIDVSGGWSRTVGLLTPSAGVIAYLRPGSEAATGEAFATLAGALGPATLTVGSNYAPAQAARRDNLYVFARAAAGIPLTPLTLRAGVGRERGGFVGGGTKIDYSVGVEARVLRVVTIGVDYVGNDQATGPTRLQRNRANGVVVRAGVQF